MAAWTAGGGEPVLFVEPPLQWSGRGYQAEDDMSSIKILIVIDNMLTRKMVRSVLAGEGYEVVEAPDGQAALELAQAHSPRLILQDLTLPDTDGRQLLQSIRALPGCSGIPILAYSAPDSPQAEARAREIGFDGYLEKPVKPARLLGVVRLHVGGEWRTGRKT